MPLVPFKSNAVTKQSYDPFRNFRDEFDRLFDNFLPTLPSTGFSEQQLMDVRIDVNESDKEIRIRAEIPGVAEKDIEVQLTREMLTIRGEKQIEQEEKEKNYHLLECRYGSFARSIRLPFEAKPDNISASFKNGVLTVTVPKPEKPAETSTRIAVKSE